MAYAELADLKARAGVLSKAWSLISLPSDDDIERLLDQVSDELDAQLGAMGMAVPVEDPVLVNSLVGVNADKALLLAIDATWPGGSGEVAALRAEVLTRVQAYDTAIQSGSFAPFAYSTTQMAVAGVGGATNYWDKDASMDVAWGWAPVYLSGWGNLGWLDPWGVPVQAGPQFVKGMRL